MKELAIPPAAARDRAAVEVVRLWIAGGKQHVTLLIGAWNEPALWGIVLADLARHVANAFEQQSGADPERTVLRIRELFDAELDAPTDIPTGVVIGN